MFRTQVLQHPWIRQSFQCEPSTPMRAPSSISERVDEDMQESGQRREAYQGGVMRVLRNMLSSETLTQLYYRLADLGRAPLPSSSSTPTIQVPAHQVNVRAFLVMVVAAMQSPRYVYMNSCILYQNKMTSSLHRHQGCRDKSVPVFCVCVCDHLFAGILLMLAHSAACVGNQLFLCDWRPFENPAHV